MARFTDSLSNLQLGKMIDQVIFTLAKMEAVLDSVNTGHGTMGRLLSDDSLYVYLANTARDLDSLLVDLQARPERYVQFSMFGKKDKKNKKKNINTE
jgi:phospholipid/cholesterol/gamma-HCH transport system substrate-binding protein